MRTCLNHTIVSILGNRTDPIFYMKYKNELLGLNAVESASSSAEGHNCYIHIFPQTSKAASCDINMTAIMVKKTNGTILQAFMVFSDGQEAVTQLKGKHKQRSIGHQPPVKARSPNQNVPPSTQTACVNQPGIHQPDLFF